MKIYFPMEIDTPLPVEAIVYRNADLLIAVQFIYADEEDDDDDMALVFKAHVGDESFTRVGLMTRNTAIDLVVKHQATYFTETPDGCQLKWDEDEKTWSLSEVDNYLEFHLSGEIDGGAAQTKTEAQRAAFAYLLKLAKSGGTPQE